MSKDFGVPRSSHPPLDRVNSLQRPRTSNLNGNDTVDSQSNFVAPPQLQNLVYDDQTPTNLTQMPSTVGVTRNMMLKGIGESSSLPRPKTSGNKADESDLVKEAKQQLQHAIEAQFREDHIMGSRGDLLLHRMQEDAAT